AGEGVGVAGRAWRRGDGGVGRGRGNGQSVALRTMRQMEESGLDRIVAGTNEAVCMIEGFARELPEQEAGDAILEAHRQCQHIIHGIEELRTKAGQGPKELPPQVPENPLAEELYTRHGAEFR